MLTASVIIFLLILSVYDLREKSLPIRLLLAGAAVIVPVSLLENGALAVAAGCLPGMALLFISLALPHSLGMGDGLVVMIAGAAMGLPVCIGWMLLGFVLAAVLSLWKILIRKADRKEQIALLPFLLLAAIGVCLL